MRLPHDAHTSRPWRIHELTRDFRLEDVWALPTPGGPYDFPRLVQLIVSFDPWQCSSRAALIEMFPPEARQRLERQVKELGDGWRFPMPPPEELANMGSLEGLDDDHLRLLSSRAVAQPFGTYTQPLRLENSAREELPKLAILCSFLLDQVQEMIASDNPMFRGLAGPEWRFVELPTGHWPVFSRPKDLANVLLDLPSEGLVRDDATSGS